MAAQKSSLAHGPTAVEPGYREDCVTSHDAAPLSPGPDD
jgi:hypothetical protein